MENEQEILVFPRELLPTDTSFVPWEAVPPILKVVEENMSWLPRNEAEQSEDLIQPIPCTIIRNKFQEYHVLRRINEGRKDLRSRITLVVGGHIDSCPGNHELLTLLKMTLKREVGEELGIFNLAEPKPVGLVLDNSSPAASRHAGFVYEIVVDDELKPLAIEEFSTRSKYSGRSFPVEGLSGFFKDDEFDPWSAIIFANYIAPTYSMDIGTQSELLLPLSD